MKGDRKYTAQQVSDAIMRAEGVITTAAKILGCERATVYAYAEEYVTVKQALKHARRGLVGEAQGYLVAMMRDRAHRDHYKAVKDILVTFDEETDWSDRSRHEHGGQVGFQVIDFNPPSDG